jgi:FHA domain
MAKLYFSLDGNTLGEFVLSKERITIGRRPTNDIHIDNLAVSGEHAVITTIAGDSFLEDLNSTNGTIVNQKPIKKHVLHHADVIEFGKYQLRFENLTHAKLSSQHGFENTAVMPSSRPSVVPSAKPKEAIHPEATLAPKEKTPIAETNVVPAPIAKLTQQAVIASPVAEPTKQTPKQGRLQVLTGASVGTELPLNKALTTLGEPGVQVAVITKRPHGYFLSHVQGDKRPFVNGNHIGPQAHQLFNNDVIDIADAKMKFYLV